ncbi:hypothetical protein [Mucilaginibacter aquatilis]|uniref:Uncharacterized protein n=1 Tax=Mucilaginibacter aquatilis TaxID=1517760 RepID=A0A6I4IAD1_9SPHI|nr:hypothetical protein [Mucilaginibacter aquatilis]MVN90466.1 hypothetical protein [Mucilaginibacter aquatilis]
MKNTDLTARTSVAISVSEAIRRTTNWREFMNVNLQGTNENMVPKAVYMSRADILAMADALKDPSVVGARAYFSLDSTEAEAEKNVVTFCMVMVRSCEDKRCGKDVIYLPNSTDGENGSIDDSGIYDYTRPCPDFCDIDSPLYRGEHP